MQAETPLSPPYVGPRPFEAEHHDRFFGRASEVNELLSLVVAERVLLLYARSGAGKTSLVNAGLLPALHEEEFEVLEPPARVQGMIPSSTLAGGQLPQVVVEAGNPYTLNALLSWEKQQGALERLARTSLVDYMGAREHETDELGLPKPRVLVLDQFEELFTAYSEHWAKREAFIREIAAALKADPLLHVVLVMREDYIADLDPYAPLLPDKLRARFRLERLRRSAALEAIVRPLQPTGYAFAGGVAEQLVEDLLRIQVQRTSGEVVSVRGEFAEPVQLQIVCQSLWQRLPKEATEIQQSHLEDLGDVTEALSRFYEGCIQRTARETGVGETRLHTWVQRTLITSAGTRGTVFRDQARDVAGTEDTNIPGRAVDVLEDLHLIRGEERAGAKWYELTHDRFIQPIQRVFEANAARRLARFERRQKAANWVGFPLLFILLPLLAAAYAKAGGGLRWVPQFNGALGAWKGFWPLGPWASAAYLVLLIGSLRWLVEVVLHAMHLETEKVNVQAILLLVGLFLGLPLLWMWTFAEVFTSWSAALSALGYLGTILLASLLVIRTFDAKRLARQSGIAFLFVLVPLLAAFYAAGALPWVLTEGVAGVVDRFAPFALLGPWLGVLVGVGIVVLLRFVAQAVLDPLTRGARQVTFVDVLLQVIAFSPLALHWLSTAKAPLDPNWAALFGLGYVAATLLASAIAIRLTEYDVFARVVAILVFAGLASALATIWAGQVPSWLPQGCKDWIDRAAASTPWQWLSIPIGVGIIVLAREGVQTVLQLLDRDPHQLTPLDVLVQLLVYSPLALFWLWAYGAGMGEWSALFGLGYVACAVLASLLTTRVRRRY